MSAFKEISYPHEPDCCGCSTGVFDAQYLFDIYRLTIPECTLCYWKQESRLKYHQNDIAVGIMLIKCFRKFKGYYPEVLFENMKQEGWFYEVVSLYKRRRVLVRHSFSDLLSIDFDSYFNLCEEHGNSGLMFANKACITRSFPKFSFNWTPKDIKSFDKNFRILKKRLNGRGL